MIVVVRSFIDFLKVTSTLPSFSSSPLGEAPIISGTAEITMYTEVITGELRILQSKQLIFVLPSDSKCTFVSQLRVGLPACVSYHVCVCVSVHYFVSLILGNEAIRLCVSVSCVCVSVSVIFHVVIT